MGEAPQEKQTLKLHYTNARSLFRKLNDIAALAAEDKPDIFLICETWLNESTINASLSIPNYEICLREDRKDTGNGIGGGLIVYSRVGTKTLPYDKYIDSNFNQQCAFSVMTDKEKLNLVFIYRPPSSDLANLDELCKIVMEADINMLIIGDFNLPSINWRSGTADPKGRRLLEAAEEANMVQLVHFPTHNKGNTLDLVLSNCPDKIFSIQNEGNLGNSDHCILSIELTVQRPKLIKKRTKNWSKADSEGIRNYLGEIDWHQLLQCECIEENWHKFCQTLGDAVNKFVPTSSQKSDDKPKWLNREIIKLVRRKKKGMDKFAGLPDRTKRG